MPIKKSLGFEFDYQYMIDEIVTIVKAAAQEHQIPDPDLFTEFGSYTVGESGATLFSVIGQKQQNDSELWYMIDGSVINNLPDTWFLHERFILLPLNKWNHEYTKVNIGGITCDNSDYYNSETHINQVYLPAYRDEEEEPLMLGFFHTGAYQDALSGIGGVKHCLIPAPKHILINLDEEGNLNHWVHREAQDAESMLNILGY
jgi:arginine decarboxylase